MGGKRGRPVGSVRWNDISTAIVIAECEIVRGEIEAEREVAASAADTPHSSSTQSGVPNATARWQNGGVGERRAATAEAQDDDGTYDAGRDDALRDRVDDVRADLDEESQAGWPHSSGCSASRCGAPTGSASDCV